VLHLGWIHACASRANAAPMTLHPATNAFSSYGLGLAAVNAIEWLKDLVFPPICGNCGRVDARFCDNCRDEFAGCPLEIAKPPVGHLDDLCSTGSHSGLIANAVRAFKYEGASDLSDLLAQRLISAFSEQTWQVDAVLPVPLHADRLLERGYNQSALMGEALARGLGIRYEPGLLGRMRNTGQQAQLSGSERQRNVAGAFAADPAVQGLSVLLVDDVVTTGATLSECAAALRAQNARAVYGIALSHA